MENSQEFMQVWEKTNNPFYPNEMRWDRASINRMLAGYEAQKTDHKAFSLPSDGETEKWFEENIGINNECSASSAIHKFRLWLKNKS
jgi:hypothetical protein